MIRRSQRFFIVCGTVALATAPAFSQQTLFSQMGSVDLGPMGGPFDPPGQLFDNETCNGTESLPSQDSQDGSFLARVADDFLIDGAGCESGSFDISSIRIQMAQTTTALQDFSVEIYDDNGHSRAPASGINPIFDSGTESNQVVLGRFDTTRHLIEAEIETPGLVLSSDTVYWVSGFGVDARLNAAAFNNFFVTSNGAAGTPANGVAIAPNAQVPDWTPVDEVVGGPALAFSFAIDGECDRFPSTSLDPSIPTPSPVGIGLVAGVLVILAVFLIASRRA